MDLTVCDLCEDPRMYMNGECSLCKSEICGMCTAHTEKYGKICVLCVEDLPFEDFTPFEQVEYNIKEDYND